MSGSQGDKGGEVETFFVLDSPEVVSNSDDLAPLLCDQTRSVAADVAEPLNGHCHVRETLTLILQGLAERVHHAAACRLVAAEGAEKVHGLSGDDAW